MSGTNIIISNCKDETQKIIPLKSDCNVTSLYFSISSTNERLIVVGEKIHPPFSNEKLFKISPRVEIINLDNKIIEERRILDHTYYTNNQDCFIYDAIIPNNSDLCFSLVKSNNMNEVETKVFAWEYVPLALKTVFTFEGHIESIIADPKNPMNLIFFNLYYIGFFQYQHAKKKIIMKNYREAADREISDVSYLKHESNHNNPTRIIVAYRHQLIEILDEELNVIQQIRILDVYKNLVKYYVINTDDEENTIEDFTVPARIQKKKNMFNFELRNKILFTVSRGKLLFVFLSETNFYLILKRKSEDDEVNYEIYSIEHFKKEVTEKSSFMINSSASKIFTVFASAKNNSVQKTNKQHLVLTRESLLRSKSKGSGASESLSFIKSNASDETTVKHELEKKRIYYSRYSLNIDYDLKEDSEFALEFEKNGIFSPLGFYMKFDFDLLKQTAFDFDCKAFALSVNPRLIITLFKASNELVIYQEKDAGRSDANCSADDYDHLEKMKSRAFEFGSSNNIFGAENKLPEVNYEVLLTRDLENETVNITVSPYADFFFLAFEESATIYGILDKEIKELYKISGLCRGCSFSETGRYIAFSTSDFSKEEFNILIIDARTFEIEYLITNLNGHATKILWMDSDRMIAALIDEKDIFGWRLTSDTRVIFQTKEKIELHRKRDASCINFLRLIEYGEKIIDFCYDYYLDHLVLIGEEKRVKIFSNNCEDSWEFLIDCKYNCVLLLRKLDVIVFGTSEGSIRICIWPIPNFTKKDRVDAPAFTEKFLHGDQVLQLYVSNDLKFLYSCSFNGSLFVSLLSNFCNDAEINLETFIYFDPKYMINKKVHAKYSDFIQFTDEIYKSKCGAINKLNFDIHGINIEYASEVDKINGDNSKTLDDKKFTINSLIEKERRKVKNLEEEKEVLTKHLREKRENQIKSFKDEMKKMKKIYKQEKDALQNATKSLSNQIKDVKENYSNFLQLIESKRCTNETKLKNLLEGVLKNLNNRLSSIKRAIETKDDLFRRKINHLEEEKESFLKDEETLRKYRKEKNNLITMELTNEIEKINKDNQNHDERISEWEKNLKELRENNADLMESFLFNTLKLKQMNKTLLENEGKISDREVVVKDKRMVNERLEKLRFVLEYQIKNLIKERVPIEDQIKNFEELHKDFYQRFNLLHAEQLNIEDFINNNLNLIDSFKDELMTKKNSLYYLKNILRGLDTEINFIVRQKIEDKNSILKKLENVYVKYLKPYFDPDSMSVYAQESKVQSKLMLKEIKVQKTKVLKDLAKKRKDIAMVKNQKDYLMLKVQAENTQLIEECGSIRLNLEDILKYINDIEKKFIELTNTHVFLTKNVTTKSIKENIKKAKNRIAEADIDKGKVAKEHEKQGNLILLFVIKFFKINLKYYNFFLILKF